MNFQRRLTRVVNIGGVPLGGTYPIRVQTMTNLPTADIDGQVAQILRSVEAGAEYVRITTPTLADVEFLRQIKKKLSKGIPAFAGMTSASNGIVPLIADVHFSPKVAMAAARVAAKVRINPGNFLRTPDTRHPTPDTRHLCQARHQPRSRPSRLAIPPSANRYPGNQPRPGPRHTLDIAGPEP